MQGLKISFEFFPPKTQEGSKNLLQTAKELCKFTPEFFSVTYGAGGSTREGTIKTFMQLQKHTNVLIAPHLSCIASTRQEILDMLAEYKARGAVRIVALRGDLPSGMGQAGEVRYAKDLVALIRESHGQYFQIDVAAYPDIHPQAKSVHHDILNLKRKADAGANGAITQYFYNPDAYFRLLDECAKEHIDIPIVPGIMPILQFSRLQQFSEMCGAEIPLWICKRFESYRDDQKAIQQFGFEVVYGLCENLLRNGIRSFHFYTLNRFEICVRLLSALGMEMQAENIIEVSSSL